MQTIYSVYINVDDIDVNIRNVDSYLYSPQQLYNTMKNIPLKYWLEQQININVYRIYIERPHELINTNLTELLLYGRAISTNNKNNTTSTLKNNNNNNNNNSPPLKITNQILQFNRKGLNISFDVTKIQKKKKNNAKLNDNNCFTFITY